MLGKVPNRNESRKFIEANGTKLKRRHMKIKKKKIDL